MRRSRVHLRLDNLPVFVGTSMYCCIDSEVEAAIKPLDDTYARVRCASRFLQRFGASPDSLNVSEEERLIMWGGYLRAALMEYAGMEDSARADFRRLGLYDRITSVDSTENAMLIVLRELRNIHVHVIQQSFGVRKTNAVLRAAKETQTERWLRSMGQEEQHETTVITIPRDVLDQLLTARGSQRFHPAELEAAIGWLDDVQHRWGIRDVVLAALDQYSAFLVSVL